MSDHRDLDLCMCGDFRSDHRNGKGPCSLNQLGHGGAPNCNRFRFASAASADEIARIRRLRGQQ